MVCLVTFPWVAIPFYWVFGRNTLTGYVQARRSDEALLNSQVNALDTSIKNYRLDPPTPFLRTAVRLGGMPVTRGNDADLLIDGEEIFEAIFHSIAKAKEYLLIHFYIVKNDRVGRRFKEALIERAQAGVRVHFLFDELGSHKLPNSYLKDLRDSGVECLPFGRTRKWWSRLQLNFRESPQNHRHRRARRLHRWGECGRRVSRTLRALRQLAGHSPSASRASGSGGANRFHGGLVLGLP